MVRTLPHIRDPVSMLRLVPGWYEVSELFFTCNGSRILLLLDY